MGHNRGPLLRGCYGNANVSGCGRVCHGCSSWGPGGCEERNIWICSGWTEEERVMGCHETPRKETTVERSGSCPTTQTGGVDKL